jgi:Uma2 family endonuclease
VEQAPNRSTPERYEIIDGVIYDMSPSPNTRHQIISSNLHGTFYAYLKGKACRVFSAPFDVYLKDGVDEWVIPDLTIVCDLSKLQDKGCVGAPDLVVEILSKATAVKDRTVKLKLYRAAGIKEYWIVDPNFGTVEVYKFGDSVLSNPEVYEAKDTLKVGIFEDLEIKMSEIFED